MRRRHSHSVVIVVITKQIINFLWYSFASPSDLARNNLGFHLREYISRRFTQINSAENRRYHVTYKFLLFIVVSRKVNLNLKC